MKFPTPVSIEWIATLINAKIEGNTTGFATGINEIHKVEEGDLVFVDHPKYYGTCIESAASRSMRPTSRLVVWIESLPDKIRAASNKSSIIRS